MLRKKRASKHAKAPTKKSAPTKRSYKLRELPIPKGRTLNDYLLNTEIHADEIDRLKRPGDLFAVKFFRSTTLMPFVTAAHINDYMQRYSFVKYYGDKEDATAELIENIKIMRFGSPAKSATDESVIKAEDKNLDSYLDSRKKQVAKRELENRSVIEKAEALTKRKGEALKKVKPTRIELLKKAVDSLEETRGELAKALQKIAALEKKAAKYAKKNEPKKVKVAKVKPPKKTVITKPVQKKQSKKAVKKTAIKIGKVKIEVSRERKSVSKKAAAKKSSPKSKATKTVQKKKAVTAKAKVSSRTTKPKSKKKGKGK